MSEARDDLAGLTHLRLRHRPHSCVRNRYRLPTDRGPLPQVIASPIPQMR